jgi:hypothetical protein
MKLLLAIFTLTLSACASVSMTSLEQDTEAKKFKVDSGKSRVYIYRNEMMGSLIKIPVSLDGKSLGQTAPKMYWAVDVKPGEHKVECYGNNQDTLIIKTKPGKATYIWQEMKMGMFQPGCALHEVDEVKGQMSVQDCKRALVQ